MADDDRDKRFAEAIHPDGDLPHPEDLRPNIPQSVAEEDSVKAANDSIRDTLLRQSGREAAEKPAPRKRTARKADDDK